MGDRGRVSKVGSRVGYEGEDEEDFACYINIGLQEMCQMEVRG